MRDEPVAVATGGLVEAIDALLERGAVVAGDVVISLAGVELIYVNLRALVASVETAMNTALDAALDARAEEQP